MEDQDKYVSTLNAPLLAKAVELWAEDEDLRNETLQIIRDWISQQPHFTCRTDAHFLLIFARGCKYNVEKMKRKLETFLTIKASLPEFFSGWDPIRPEIQSALQVGMQLPIPDYDTLGRKVVIVRSGCFDPRVHRPEDLEKANFMVMECLAKKEERITIGGLVILFDMKGISMAHMMHKPLHMVKKQLKYIQEAIPLSPKSLIFIRTSPVCSAILGLMVSVFSDKMKRRIQVLGNDLDALHEIFPKSLLPSDYGGDGMSLKQLTVHWKEQVEHERKYLMSQEQYRVDESKRPVKPRSSLLRLFSRDMQSSTS